MKKTGTKSTKSSTAKTKQPVLSTGKKIGLTVYFTFVFTLMGIMGLQIWMNSMNDNLNNPTLTSPQTTQTTDENVGTQSLYENFTPQNNQTETFDYQQPTTNNPQNNTQIDTSNSYDQNSTNFGTTNQPIAR